MEDPVTARDASGHRLRSFRRTAQAISPEAAETAANFLLRRKEDQPIEAMGYVETDDGIYYRRTW
jgi:hypothetical protein